MSLQELLRTNNVNKIESKSKVVEVGVDDAGVHTFSSNYPLMAVVDGFPLTYGGDAVTHAVSAAWETVDPTWLPNSLQVYFMKPGRPNTPVYWEVSKLSDGKRFAVRSVRGIQNGVVFFTMQTSFSKEGARTDVRFQTKPLHLFDKYKDTLDNHVRVVHTHNLILNIMPLELLTTEDQPMINGAKSDEFMYETTGNRTLGYFFKINDTIGSTKNQLKANILSLCFLLDSMFLLSVVSALGLSYTEWPTINRDLSYFSTSLDHVVYFHNSDIRPDEWLYMEYRFPRMNDDRILCYCSAYNLEGVLVCTVVQEALVGFTEPVVRRIEDRAEPKL